MNSKLIHHDRLPSTNDECKRLAAVGEPEGTIVWADSQSGGRGRADHRWQSEPGGLYCSLLLRPRAIASLQMLSVVAGLALVAAIAEAAALNVQLKWPNDLVFGPRKLGGFLGEVIWSGQHPEFAVLGLGLNVNQQSFPPELAAIASSLALETGRQFEIHQLLDLFVVEFATEYQAGSLQHPRAELLRDYRNRLATLGQQVRIDTGDALIEGQAVDIDEAGHLILETAQGRQVIVAGSVMVSNGQWTMDN